MKTIIVNSVPITYPANYGSVQSYVNMLFHNLQSRIVLNNDRLFKQHVAEIKNARTAGLDYSEPDKVPAFINKLLG